MKVAGIGPPSPSGVGLHRDAPAVPSSALGAQIKIDVRGVSKRFRAAGREIAALETVDFRIQEGEFVCIVGPSGCGKSTLLRILAGLETPSLGEVVIARNDPSRPLNAMVFQENSIFPWMTVRNNVAYGLDARGADRTVRDGRVDRLLAVTGLDRFADAYPHQLSGGMKQRASVARAFASDPEILLMDEPFAALDEQNKILLQDELLRLWSESRKTVVFITHSIDEALVLGDRVLVMSARPGRIKTDLPIGFARPRAIYELKADLEFGRMSRKIWHHLREEVRRE